MALEGNQTLGREESRGARILARKDYCKLHIIAHYVKVLLGENFCVIPASQVGNDAVGQQLLAEMDDTGLDTSFMQVSAQDATLFSLCFVYPDGSGGNLTATNAATAAVDVAAIDRLEPEFARWEGRGIAMAAPEVSLEARQRLLELGSAHGFWRVTSLTSGEAASQQALGLIRLSDLLAMNLDEAAALAGISTERGPEDIFQAARDTICAVQPHIQLSLTAGRQGSWFWDGNSPSHTPVFPVEVVCTAGAGDAHLAALIAARTAGLPAPQAQQFAALTAACSVTSPDTIHKGLNCDALFALAQTHSFHIDPQVQACLVKPESTPEEFLQ
jgi:sugar/nucleoside kinase (ribokinase family)